MGKDGKDGKKKKSVRIEEPENDSPEAHVPAGKHSRLHGSPQRRPQR